MEDFACGIAILAILGYVLNLIAWIFKDIEIKGGFFDFIIGFLCGLFSFALISYGFSLLGCGDTLALIIGGIIGFIIFSIYINIRHKFSTNLIILSTLLAFYYYT